MSSFFANPGADSHEHIPSNSDFFSTTADVSEVNGISFSQVIMPQDLEMGDGEIVEDSFDTDSSDMVLSLTKCIPLIIQEFGSPIDSSQTRTSHSTHIQNVLSLLHNSRLSPFDLILEILDENKSEYTSHRQKFYKEDNHKLEKILNTILANDSGKTKLRKWIQQPTGLWTYPI